MPEIIGSLLGQNVSSHEPSEGTMCMDNMVITAIASVAALWFLLGFYQLSPQQSALLSLFGKPIAAKDKPGLKWRPLFIIGKKKISTAIQEFTFEEKVFTRQDVEVASSTATPHASEGQAAPSVVATTKQTAMAAVTVAGVVQFSVMPGLPNLVAARFKLGDPEGMIKQRFQNAIRGKMNTMTMWDALSDRDQAAGSIKEDLSHVTTEFGHMIVNISITSVTPDAAIVAANNAMIASAAEMQTKANRGRGEQLETLAIAKGRADARIEEGRGIAGQLERVAEGRQKAVAKLKEALGDDPTGELTAMIVFTAWTEMMSRLGDGGKSKIIFADTSASAPGSIFNSLRQAVIAANEAAADTTDGKTTAAQNPAE